MLCVILYGYGRGLDLTSSWAQARLAVYNKRTVGAEERIKICPKHGEPSIPQEVEFNALDSELVVYMQANVRMV